MGGGRGDGLSQARNIEMQARKTEMQVRNIEVQVWKTEVSVRNIEVQVWNIALHVWKTELQARGGRGVGVEYGVAGAEYRVAARRGRDASAEN